MPISDSQNVVICERRL